jgi:pentatricopeptide repeat protein
MIVRCDALDLLIATMPRSVELGICLSLNSLHYIMSEYGNALRVDQLLLLLMQSLEKAGIVPSTQTYYIVMRACFNARRYEEALQFYNDCRAAGLRVRPSVVKLMLQACLPVEMPVEGEAGGVSSNGSSNDAAGEQQQAADASSAVVAAVAGAGDAAAGQQQEQREQQQEQQQGEQQAALMSADGLPSSSEGSSDAGDGAADSQQQQQQQQ